MSALSRVRVFAGAAEAVGGSEFSLQVDSIGALLAELNPSTDAHVADVLARCSFAVTLRTHSKTTNGEYFGYPEASETAAFALAIDAGD